MANYIIGAVIVVLVALALRRVIRQAKTGKPACCGDCGIRGRAAGMPPFLPEEDGAGISLPRRSLILRFSSVK